MRNPEMVRDALEMVQILLPASPLKNKCQLAAAYCATVPKEKYEFTEYLMIAGLYVLIYEEGIVTLGEIGKVWNDEIKRLVNEAADVMKHDNLTIISKYTNKDYFNTISPEGKELVKGKLYARNQADLISFYFEA